ncbi:hypothetical protein GGR91_000622 [Sphingorhabdus rigui]|uniref:Uncharacterized protein n=1 Tax=Sphingorhabdus rigui TaxID=1282858 RepID=A0A840B0F3_9SPHN|nr:hypothetical protein [Sphingorhabdus rigui]MBB3942400.1 hypothetical protein [Sphingorhabdus rigui]
MRMSPHTVSHIPADEGMQGTKLRYRAARAWTMGAKSRFNAAG